MNKDKLTIISIAGAILATILVIAVPTVLKGGCSDAKFSQFGALNSKHKIEFFSGGKLVKTWVSTGKVLSSETSDGYFFRDSETGINVEVSGDVVISRIEE